MKRLQSECTPVRRTAACLSGCDARFWLLSVLLQHSDLMDGLIGVFGGKLHLDVQLLGSSSAAINVIQIDDILTQSLASSNVILIFKQ